MTRRLMTLCVLYGTSLAAADRAAIEQLDRGWVKAVLAKDFAALDRIYADDVVYAHASGVVDTKSTYMEKLKSGKQIYKTMEQKNISVRLHGDSAITHSWMRVTGVNAQGPFDDKVMMIHFWVLKNGQWRLAAHQTTRVDQMP